MVSIDIAIFGGGIAGLWLANVLSDQGYRCVLLETGTLGGEQTMLSQGIIHGGLKYALGGALSSESEAIAGMPDRWRACLEGRGDLDLRGVQVLSDTQHLWSAGSMASRVTTFFASRMLRGRIRKLRSNQYPSALADPAFRGQVYELDDLVLDTESLTRHLAERLRGKLLRYDPARDSIEWSDQGVARIRAGNVELAPSLSILAAGQGNQRLLEAAHQHDLALDVNAQVRPLHMLLVEHRLGHQLYAHCVGASNKPRLTITTHPSADGALVWYLGGDLAERGVNLDEAELIRQGKQELSALLPWIDFSEARFAGVRISRAEPRQDSLIKPDNAYAELRNNLIVTWPTKLTLAPDLGDRVTALVREAGLTPGADTQALPEGLPAPSIATPFWRTCFDRNHG